MRITSGQSKKAVKRYGEFMNAVKRFELQEGGPPAIYVYNLFCRLVRESPKTLLSVWGFDEGSLERFADIYSINV